MLDLTLKTEEDTCRGAVYRFQRSYYMGGRGELVVTEKLIPMKSLSCDGSCMETSKSLCMTLVPGEEVSNTGPDGVELLLTGTEKLVDGELYMLGVHASVDMYGDTDDVEFSWSKFKEARRDE